MNTQANAIPEPETGGRGVAPALWRATRPFYWSLQRELWENRAVYLAPLAVSGTFLLVFLLSVGHVSSRICDALVVDPGQQANKLSTPYDYASGMIMGTALIVSIFYCLEALHGERRDRSILFWRSLPVSDWTTVLAKTCVPMVIIPAFTLALTAAMHFVMLLLSSAASSARGVSPAALWHLPLGRSDAMLFYHLLTMHVLWQAPVYAWLLLVSAWARRATFLWAFVPAVAISIVEKVLFNTSYFAGMLRYRLAGSDELVAATAGNFPFNPGMHLNPGKFLETPGLWTGLAVAALLLAATVQVRRYRGPI